MFVHVSGILVKWNITGKDIVIFHDHYDPESVFKNVPLMLWEYVYDFSSSQYGLHVYSLKCHKNVLNLLVHIWKNWRFIIYSGGKKSSWLKEKQIYNNTERWTKIKTIHKQILHNYIILFSIRKCSLLHFQRYV